MEQISYDQVINMIKSRSLNFYNFYNVDIPVSMYYAMKYYNSNPADTIETPQHIKTQFTDIEVFTNNQGIDSTEEGQHPVSAISTYNNKHQIMDSFIYLMPQNFEKFGISTDPNFDMDQHCQKISKQLKQQLIDDGYLYSKFIQDDFQLNIHVFPTENDLHVAFWNRVHEFDAHTLSGFYSDTFDYPYLWYRGNQLFGTDNTKKLFSKFNHVDMKYGMISIPEFTITDILYLYKPREEGGLMIAH